MFPVKVIRSILILGIIPSLMPLWADDLLPPDGAQAVDREAIFRLIKRAEKAVDQIEDPNRQRYERMMIFSLLLDFDFIDESKTITKEQTGSRRYFCTALLTNRLLQQGEVESSINLIDELLPKADRDHSYSSCSEQLYAADPQRAIRILTTLEEPYRSDAFLAITKYLVCTDNMTAIQSILDYITDQKCRREAENWLKLSEAYRSGDFQSYLIEHRDELKLNPLTIVNLESYTLGTFNAFILNAYKILSESNCFDSYDRAEIYIKLTSHFLKEKERTNARNALGNALLLLTQTREMHSHTTIRNPSYKIQILKSIALLQIELGEIGNATRTTREAEIYLEEEMRESSYHSARSYLGFYPSIFTLWLQTEQTQKYCDFMLEHPELRTDIMGNLAMYYGLNNKVKAYQALLDDASTPEEELAVCTGILWGIYMRENGTY